MPHYQAEVEAVDVNLVGAKSPSVCVVSSNGAHQTNHLYILLLCMKQKAAELKRVKLLERIDVTPHSCLQF